MPQVIFQHLWLAIFIFNVKSQQPYMYFCKGNGCALPDNANDEYCHDENNNAGCNYDGGACCPGDDPPRLWDAYCSVCECLEGICRFIFIVSMAKEGSTR